MRGKIPISMSLTAALLMTVSCSKINIRENREGKTSPGKECILNDKKTEQHCMKEGFIDKNTYRIIILAPLNDYKSDEKKLKTKAQSRAVSSLQKFLISKNRIIDSKTRTMLQNLVTDNGTLICQDLKFRGNSVFYYDINRDNIMLYLRDISAAH